MEDDQGVLVQLFNATIQKPVSMWDHLVGYTYVEDIH